MRNPSQPGRPNRLMPVICIAAGLLSLALLTSDQHSHAVYDLALLGLGLSVAALLIRPWRRKGKS